MASVSATLGGVDLPLDSNLLKDLRFFTGDNLHWVIDGALAPFRDMPLSQIDAPHNAAALSYSSDTATWNPEGGPVSFTLQGDVSGAVWIVHKGSILQDALGGSLGLLDGFVEPKELCGFDIPAGTAFVATQLHVGICGSVKAAEQVGAIGITEDASASSKFRVLHFKALPADTLLRDALARALEGLVLPLHPQTVSNMDNQDVLIYDVNGTFQVGFGVSYGIKSSLAEFSYSPHVTGDLASYAAPSISYQPELSASVGVAVEFPWARTFQCLLRRQDAATAQLHLFRGDDFSTSVKLTGGVVINSNAKASPNLDAQQVLNGIGKAVESGGTSSTLVSQLLANSQDAAKQYINDLNSYGQQYFNMVADRCTQLALLIEGTTKNTSCFTYLFQVNQPEFLDVWKLAIEGRFTEALQYPKAVTLEAGSGLEQYHGRLTEITLDIFGFRLGQSSSTSYNAVDILYGGNNHFQMTDKTGREYLTSNLLSSSSANLYFAATGDTDQPGASAPTTNLRTEFHGVLSALKNDDRVRSFASILSSLRGPGADEAVRQLQLYTDKHDPCPFVLDITFGPKACQAITSTPFDSKGHPPPLSQQTADAANWQAFVVAADHLKDSAKDAFGGLLNDSIGNFRSYGSWAAYNAICTQNALNQPAGPGAPYPPPNRRNFAVPAFMEGDLPVQAANRLLTGGNGPLYALRLFLYYEAGQHFMNLCDDLRQNIALQAQPTISWKMVTDSFSREAKDLAPWFSTVTLCALAGLVADETGLVPQVMPRWGTDRASVTVTVG